MREGDVLYVFFLNHGPSIFGDLGSINRLRLSEKKYGITGKIRERAGSSDLSNQNESSFG